MQRSGRGSPKPMHSHPAVSWPTQDAPPEVPFFYSLPDPEVCEGPRWGYRALPPVGQDPSGKLFLRLLCPAWGFCGCE